MRRRYRNLFRRLAWSVALLSAPGAAAASPDVIAALCANAQRLMATQGYAATGWQQRGTLPAGREARIPVTLTGGGDYQLLGVCDGGCTNLDIRLLDAAGRRVAADEAKDDAPMVGIARSGSYTATVVMAGCSFASCRYGVMAFSR